MYAGETNGNPTITLHYLPWMLFADRIVMYTGRAVNGNIFLELNSICRQIVRRVLGEMPAADRAAVH